MTKQQRLASAIKNYTGIERGRNAVDYKEEAKQRAAAQYAGLYGRQDKMSAIPQNSLLGSISSGLESARDFGNKATVPDFIPYLGGTGVGDMIVGQSPEEVENWSYGNSPFDMPYQGTGGLLPRIKPNRKTSLGDTLLFGADLIGVGAVAKPLAKAAIKGATPKAQEMLENTMRKTGLLSDAAPYHGSPHQFLPTESNPLGEFDASKIGTGEGAQVYGYGHYFAEQPSVAKTYIPKPRVGYNMPQLEGKSAVILGNKIVSTHATAEAANKALGKVKSGSLYKVDLPDEQIAKMLDWDKPLPQQPESVKAGLRKIGIAVDDPRYGTTRGSDFYNNIVGSLADKRGSEPFKAIRKFEGNPEKAARIFSEAGIPGIKYLDQGSRAGGKGTSNFVVFPGGEKMLNILERN